MNIINKDEFIKKGTKTLEEILDVIEELDNIKLETLKSEQTALFIVDMINGFVREGALKSERVEEIIQEIVRLSESCDKLAIQKLAFADCHTDASPEFGAYPKHCITQTSESQVVDEIKQVGGYKLIEKNSTNGFHEDELKKWLSENPQITNFVITGDCTDICVQQFAITLKTWFNMHNTNCRVIVPINAVETYDLGLHNAELTNVMALYNMMINGVEVVKSVD